MLEQEAGLQNFQTYQRQSVIMSRLCNDQQWPDVQYAFKLIKVDVWLMQCRRHAIHDYWTCKWKAPYTMLLSARNTMVNIHNGQRSLLSVSAINAQSLLSYIGVNLPVKIRAQYTGTEDQAPKVHGSKHWEEWGVGRRLRPLSRSFWFFDMEIVHFNGFMVL